MSNVFEVKNLSFYYHRQVVLSDVNFCIESGIILSITGPNGSGKTTLLKLLLGLLKPASGEVLFMGKPVLGLKKSDFEVGYLPQMASYEGMNLKFLIPVDKIIEMGLRADFSKEEKKQKIEGLLDYFQIQNLKHKNFSQLSGGEKQKVLLARALAGNPKALILDEPSTGIDTETRQFIYETLKNLSRNENTAIILVTHDLNIVPVISDRVGCLNQHLFFHNNPGDFLSCPVFEDEMKSGLELLVHGEKTPHRYVLKHPEGK